MRIRISIERPISLGVQSALRIPVAKNFVTVDVHKPLQTSQVLSYNKAPDQARFTFRLCYLSSMLSARCKSRLPVNNSVRIVSHTSYLMTARTYECRTPAFARDSSFLMSSRASLSSHIPYINSYVPFFIDASCNRYDHGGSSSAYHQAMCVSA